MFSLKYQQSESSKSTNAQNIKDPILNYHILQYLTSPFYAHHMVRNFNQPNLIFYIFIVSSAHITLSKRSNLSN